MMFICLLLLGLLKCEDNPHDTYNQAQQIAIKNDASVSMAQELMDLFISRKAICVDTDTYISTFRWPSLEAINTVVNDMKRRGWRISLEEIKVVNNEVNGCKRDRNILACASTNPLFINNSLICMRSIQADRSIQPIFLSDSYAKCDTWFYFTDPSNFCPKVIQVIHFRHKEF